VTLTDSSVEISKVDGEPAEREPFEVGWDADAVELGAYEDFMLKEISEQPAALGATLAERLGPDGTVNLLDLAVDFSDVERVVVVACGTAYHAGLLGKYAIEKLACIPVEVAVASEYRYADPIGDERTLVVAVSQSGETTDTLAAIQAARTFGGRVLAVTNTQGSLITREAEAVLFTKAGPEIGVAATKTFLTQVAVLDLPARLGACARPGNATGRQDKGDRTRPPAGTGEGRGGARSSREPDGEGCGGLRRGAVCTLSRKG